MLFRSVVVLDQLLFEVVPLALHGLLGVTLLVVVGEPPVVVCVHTFAASNDFRQLTSCEPPEVTVWVDEPSLFELSVWLSFQLSLSVVEVLNQSYPTLVVVVFPPTVLLSRVHLSVPVPVFSV